MTHTTYKSIISLFCTTLLATSACKDAQIQADAAPKTTKAPAKAEDDNEAIFAAMGCPADQLTATGCKVCLSPDGEVWEDGVAVTGEVRRGRYSEHKGPQALVSYPYCASTSHQETAEVLVYLEREEGSERWAPKASTIITAESKIKKCVELIHQGKQLTALLCHATGGRQAPNQQAISLINWNKLSSADNARLRVPERMAISMTEDVRDCAKNINLTVTPRPELKDTNADGELDVVVHVELEESKAGEGERVLGQEAIKRAYKLVFEAQPDGTYKETTGNAVHITERPEYAECS